MIATVYAARIDGTARAAHLSLHTTYEGAVTAVLRAGAEAHRFTLEYVPEELRPLTERAAQEYGFTYAAALRKAEDRLAGIGLRASVEELPVELDAPEPAEEPPAGHATWCATNRYGGHGSSPCNCRPAEGPGDDSQDCGQCYGPAHEGACP